MKYKRENEVESGKNKNRIEFGAIFCQEKNSSHYFLRIFEPNSLNNKNKSTNFFIKMSRRRIPPTSRPTPPSFQTASSPLNNEFNEPVIPKHIAFIQTNFTKGENEILCEFIMFMFTMIAASSQFVHLYRSVWWYQESYTNYSMVS